MGGFDIKAEKNTSQYDARMQIYGGKLEQIRDLSGGHRLRLDIIDPSLLRNAAPGFHPDFHVDKLRAGEERTPQNIFRAALGRLEGRNALISKYGPFENDVIDAVHSLLTTVNPADGNWHPVLEEWGERKRPLDHWDMAVDLSGLPFRNKDLSGANLSRVIMTGCDLEGSDLSEAYFPFADVRFAFMRKADLSGAVCHGLSASHADLQLADLSDVNARIADFSGANLEYANMERGNFSGADFNGARVLFSNPFRAQFCGANLDGTGALLMASLYDVSISNHSEEIYRYMMEISSLCSSPSAVMRGLLREHKLGYIPGRLGIVGLTASRRIDTAHARKRLNEMVRSAYIGRDMSEGITPRFSEVEPAAKVFADCLEQDGDLAMAKYLVSSRISNIFTQEMMHSFYG